MKKSLIFLITAALVLCVIAGFSACADKPLEIRQILALDKDGLAFDQLNLGEFFYKSSVDQEGDYPAPNDVSFKVVYDDGSETPISETDAEFRLKEIKHDGNAVESDPSVYDIGSWEFIYEYKGFTAKVYFTILPSVSANYTLSGIPSKWDYSLMPDLTETAEVNGYSDELIFSGNDENVWLYYIPVQKYDELTAGGSSLNFKDLIKASAHYTPYSEFGYLMPAGEYYIYAEIAESGNYARQITDLKRVTVNREKLEMTAPEVQTTTYYFNVEDGPGNAKISDVLVSSFTAYAVNGAGESVYLKTADTWLNPDEEVSVSTPDKTYKRALVPALDENNYDTEGLYVEYKVIATKGYFGIEPGLFEFDYSGEALVIDREITLNEYASGGFRFFNSLTLTDDNDAAITFFKMTDVRDSEGKKLPVYNDGSTTPVITGDEGASAKIIIVKENSVYDYYIALNTSATEGNYSFTVSLIDEANFRWGDYLRDYGSEPITLNYTVTKNDNEAYFEYISSPLKNGKFEFSLTIAEKAYDQALVNTLKVSVVDKYVDDHGTIHTTNSGLTFGSSVEASASEPDNGKIILTIKVPVTLPAAQLSYYTACFNISMQTSADYDDINFTTYAVIQK